MFRGHEESICEKERQDEARGEERKEEVEKSWSKVEHWSNDEDIIGTRAQRRRERREEKP